MVPLILFVLFLSIPIIEIALFISIGGAIGLWWTIAIVIGTAMLGTAMLRQQGLSVLSRAQDEINSGKVPLARIADGVFLLVAAVLLLTPGFLTDGAGFLLFIPLVRQTIGKAILAWASKSGKVTFVRSTYHEERRTYRDPDILEGEAVEIDVEDAPPR